VVGGGGVVEVGCMVGVMVDGCLSSAVQCGGCLCDVCSLLLKELVCIYVPGIT